jgi:hypothetical protein
VQDTEQIK